MADARHQLTRQLITQALQWHGELSAMCHEQGTLTPDEVHRVRVISKALRAFWQLLRPLDVAGSRDAISNLSAAAATLAGARDNEVMSATLLNLSRHAPRKSDREVFTQARDRLFADHQPGDTSVTAELLEAIAADAQRWRSLQSDFDDRTLIDRGMRRSWRKIRNRMLAAMDGDALPLWHDLRKWVKYLACQLELLEQAGLTSPLPLSDVKRLGRDLGRLHDLHILTGHVDAHRARFDSDDDAAYCLHLLRNQEARLLGTCRGHAAHLTQVKPGFLRKQLLRQLP